MYRKFTKKKLDPCSQVACCVPPFTPSHTQSGSQEPEAKDVLTCGSEMGFLATAKTMDPKIYCAKDLKLQRKRWSQESRILVNLKCDFGSLIPPRFLRRCQMSSFGVLTKPGISEVRKRFMYRKLAN